MNRQWYFSSGDGVKGPVDTAFAKDLARENPGAWCWHAQMDDWQLVHTVPEIRRVKKDGVTPFPPPPERLIHPKPSRLPTGDLASIEDKIGVVTDSDSSARTGPPSSESPSMGGKPYRICGTETQFLELTLKRGDSVVAEAGAMMFKTSGVRFETIFGDGHQTNESGIGASLLGAGRRWLTGESLFTTVFTQEGHGDGIVAFGAPFPGTILAIDLSEHGGQLICQKDSFLAGLDGISIGIHFQRRVLTGLFGGEGFILQKLEGDGLVFIHAGGTLRRFDLSAGQEIQVDTGCLAAMSPTVDYSLERVGGVRTMFFGGEGFFLAKVRGPGTVWLQSLPFSRLAGRMLANSSVGSRSQGEGSILGGLGDLFGDR